MARRRHEPVEMAPEEESVRLDKWLWAARFFKTRALATEAIQGGHVHVNGSRVKPARPVRAGERLSITKDQTSWEVVVLALSERRGPASEAQQLYEESEDSRRRRAEQAEARRLLADSAPRPDRRPDKRDRRQINRFRER